MATLPRNMEDDGLWLTATLGALSMNEVFARGFPRTERAGQLGCAEFTRLGMAVLVEGT